MVIWGARVNPELEGTLRVTLIMTGVQSPHLFSGSETGDIELTVSEKQNMKETLNVDLDLYQLEEY